jgi:DNA-binding CsgD family transcriptional regulator
MVPERFKAHTFQAVDGDYVVFEIPLASWRIPSSLTPAEQAVARSVLDGLSAAEIARQRSTSPWTVRNQVRSIYHKLGVGSHAELAARCADREDGS